MVTADGAAAGAAEITGTPPAQAQTHAPPESPCDRRPTRPGTKRLLLTLSVVLSFLLAFPLLYKSTSIHRSPLPSLSSPSLPSPPLPLHVLLLLSRPSSPSDGRRLHLAISHDLLSRSPALNFSLSLSFDSPAVQASDIGGDDEDVDELLDSALWRDAGDRVYTVVAAEGEGEMRVVVGKHRHAWMVGRLEEDKVVEMIGRIFVDYFVNGGTEGGGEAVGKGEFVPVGSDGSVVLSFSLLNADPTDWVYDWDFQNISEIMLAPVVEALAPVANMRIESQVLYHTPKSSVSHWDKDLKSHTFTINDLPFFVNSNEWHLDTSVAAAGRSKVLQFVVYVPSAGECPLLLRLPNGETSKTNGFISPMWGGVVVWNPPSCSKDSQGARHARSTISSQDLQNIFQIFIVQIRLLFGLRSNNLNAAEVGISKFIASPRGFTEWELDVLYRHHASFNLLSCVATLDSLSKLVQSLPRMIVLDEIGKQVEFSLEAATLAQKNASLGRYDASAVSSRNARALAEDAFFHPSVMSISYASVEHYFAIYMPFFAPVSLHVLLAAIYELKRYRKERAKYLAFMADQAKAS